MTSTDNDFLNSQLGKILFRNKPQPLKETQEVEPSGVLEQEFEDYQDEVFNQAADWYEKNKNDDPWGQSPAEKASSATFFSNMPKEIADVVEEIEEYRGKGNSMEPFRKTDNLDELFED